MKKFAFVLLIVIVSLLLFSCKNPVGYDSYFNDFQSVDGYTKAEEVLNLKNFKEFYQVDSQGNVITKREVYVSSYDFYTNIYTISTTETLDGEDYVYYGFCTANELLIEPKYIDVLDMCGDYAIVTKNTATGSHLMLGIGMVKVRGENTGREYGFIYSYVPTIIQYAFLNEQYVVMMGDLSTEEASNNKTIFTYATVYDYVSSGGKGLLEVAKISEVDNVSLFTYAEGYIITTIYNTARFYSLSNIDSNGFLEKRKTINCFDSASYDQSYVLTQVYYVGNGWFVVTGTYSTTTSYDTYEIVKDDGGSTHYMSIKSYRYNFRTNMIYDTDRVRLVANKYSEKYIRGISNAANSTVKFSTDIIGKRGQYVPPIMPTSSLIKDGYSIVYYYWDYIENGVRDWATTFSIYDENATRIEQTGIAMPLLFIDGYGFQNGDPNFDVPMRSAEYFKKNKDRVVIDDVTDYIAYDTYLYHNNMIMAYKLTLKPDLLSIVTYMGAYDSNGNLAVPFRYHELTPFFGEYATGSIVSESGDDAYRNFYRVEKNGAHTEIKDVYALYNGVYVTVSGEKYGLKANNGNALITNSCEYVNVITNYLTDGKFVKTFVATVEDGLGVLYKLS